MIISIYIAKIFEKQDAVRPGGAHYHPSTLPYDTTPCFLAHFFSPRFNTSHLHRIIA